MVKNKVMSVFGTVILIVCTVCGCSYKDNVQPQTVVDFEEYMPPTTEAVIVRDEKTSESVEEIETESETEQEAVVPYSDRMANGESVEYSIEEAAYENDKVHIKYPVITGMADTGLQNSINDNIKRIAFLDTDKEDISYYSLEFLTATRGAGMVSFILSGNMNTQDSAHPVSIVKTLNIDMKTGKNIRLKDYADMGRIVSDLENANGYCVINEGVSVEDFTFFMNNGYVTDYAITMLDYDFDFGNPELKPVGFSCIRDNHLVMFIEAEHAMGDYVEIEFNYDL